MDKIEPGSTINPQAAQPEVEVSIAHAPEEVVQKPAKKISPAAPVAVTEAVQPAPAAAEEEPKSPWRFREDEASASQPISKKSAIKNPIAWTASEFIHHDKSVGWYGKLALVTIVVAAGVYLLTKDKISTGAIVFAAVVFGVYANRKPRTLDYKIENEGVTVGQKFYDYEHFKSFAVAEEGAFSSIVLMPLKRFSPLVSLYYDPKDERKIMELLSDRLPLEDHKLDALDHFMQRIRF